MKNFTKIIALIVANSVSFGVGAASYGSNNADFSGKTFVSEFESGIIKLSFLEGEYAILDTKCHDAKGIYRVVENGDNTYKVSFTLQEYINVVPNCEQSQYNNNMAKVALNTLNSNSSMEIFMTKNLTPKINMYSDTGSIFSYDKVE
ncbi:MAG: hypothetical protein CL760_01785 [Chloroflexi bacterium]|nr:hypothetical protein [Chloroflexota bacterium]|tara:strand:+ start:26067 stop:26507 length:441 start_codon:yes stop_codon:yes gene_type:complete